MEFDTKQSFCESETKDLAVLRSMYGMRERKNKALCLFVF